MVQGADEGDLQAEPSLQRLQERIPGQHALLNYLSAVANLSFWLDRLSNWRVGGRVAGNYLHQAEYALSSAPCRSCWLIIHIRGRVLWLGAQETRSRRHGPNLPSV